MILLIIGLLMQHKMNGPLNAAVEQSIARQTADFSLLAAERFNWELAELTYAAKYMENHPGELADVLAGFESMERPGVTSGLIDIDGNSVLGSAIESKAFSRLRHSFGGNPIIDYAETQGLIFAVPVYCSMVGYVPWEAVAGSISRIYLLVSSVVALLLLLFAIASIYLFMMQARAAESDALKTAKRLADQASAAKSQFLSQMSHEIRTPINAVLGLNEMIIRESKESDTQVYAHKIASAGQSLLSLINDVLDFSKIEAGHLELTEASYEPTELFRDVITLAEPRAKKKGLKLFCHIAENIPRELWGDAARLRQIIVNLMTNAVKYTPQGQVELFADCQTGDEQEIILAIKVKDTGLGIKEEDKERLFRDFERLDTVKNSSIEGTGLGLAITYRLLKLMGGEITVTSEYGQGSTFSLTIPQIERNPNDGHPLPFGRRVPKTDG
ncbi:MAG: hypothetical protein IJ849_00080 [Selenomonadaceae bacterium]|nr:hypothetical protein [Selenomonadaceae bacterium]